MDGWQIATDIGLSLLSGTALAFGAVIKYAIIQNDRRTVSLETAVKDLIVNLDAKHTENTQRLAEMRIDFWEKLDTKMGQTDRFYLTRDVHGKG